MSIDCSATPVCAQYVHHVPGRLRVRVSALKRNHAMAREASAVLESMPGVISVDVNVVTGSVLVNYDGSVTSHAKILPAVEEIAGRFPCTSESQPAVSARVGLRVHQVSERDLWAGKLTRIIAGYVIEAAVERAVLALVTALI